jgi:Uncharacterized protein conserved in bacteria
VAEHEVPSGLSVELVVQYRDEGRADQYHLQRTQHRVAAGSTIRQLLQQALQEGQTVTLMADIEQKRLGLSRFGRRAWLDDPLHPDDRIEILCPVVADVKAARFERVTKARAARNQRPGNMKARG